MAELAAGDAVKIDYKANPHSSIFYIDDIRNGIAALYQLSSPRVGKGEKVREQKVAVERLTKVCREVTWNGYSSHTCGRPAKEGKLCGIHAGARKRVETNNAKRQAEADAAASYRAETRLLEAHLNSEIDKRELRTQAPSLTVLHARNGTVSIKLDELLYMLRNA